MVFIYAGNEDAVTYSERIRYLMPLAGIVILADDDRFAMEALHLHAQGYIIRPATEDQIRRELDLPEDDDVAALEEWGHRVSPDIDGAIDWRQVGDPEVVHRIRPEVVVDCHQAGGGCQVIERDVLIFHLAVGLERVDLHGVCPLLSLPGRDPFSGIIRKSPKKGIYPLF